MALALIMALAEAPGLALIMAEALGLALIMLPPHCSIMAEALGLALIMLLSSCIIMLLSSCIIMSSPPFCCAAAADANSRSAIALMANRYIVFFKRPPSKSVSQCAVAKGRHLPFSCCLYGVGRPADQFPARSSVNNAHPAPEHWIAF